MHFAALASGSSGNAIVVGKGKRSFLVDCGISLKNMVHNLALLNIAPEEIEGIFITHEHTDHIKGAGAVARKLKIPIYASAKIWEELDPCIGRLKRNKSSGAGFLLLCRAESKDFETSHDSRESFGVRIEAEEPETGNKKVLGIATDTGIITEDMHRNLKGCDALIVEANHDHEMLWQGSYPWYLKKRISGNLGHLENRQLAEGLLQWIDGNTKRVVLAHLSNENNTPEIALATVMRILKDSPIVKENPDLRLRVAPRYTPHELIVLDQ